MRIGPNHRRRLEEAAYLLRIRENGKPFPVPGHPVAADGIFPLPIPPQSLTPRQSLRIGYMEAPHYAITDEQGLSAPEWDLAGQFLLRPMRVRGRVLDGWEIQRALESFIRYYAEKNKERGRNLQPLLTLEFHDTYSGESWVVVPLGVPLGERSAALPQHERYSLRLKGVRPLDSKGPKAVGPLEQELIADPNERLLSQLEADARSARPSPHAGLIRRAAAPQSPDLKAAAASAIKEDLRNAMVREARARLEGTRLAFSAAAAAVGSSQAATILSDYAVFAGVMLEQLERDLPAFLATGDSAPVPVYPYNAIPELENARAQLRLSGDPKSKAALEGLTVMIELAYRGQLDNLPWDLGVSLRWTGWLIFQGGVSLELSASWRRQQGLLGWGSRVEARLATNARLSAQLSLDARLSAR